jgi:hypothetical protein
MGRSLGSGLRGFKESISGEDSLSSITEHAPPRTEEPAATPVAGDQGADRIRARPAA